eukprot:472584_1
MKCHIEEQHSDDSVDVVVNQEHKEYFDMDSDEDYYECIINPQNDRRKIITDSQNKRDTIIQCMGTLEVQYIPDQKESTHGTGTVIHIDDQNRIYVLTAAHNVRGVERKCQQCNRKTLRRNCKQVGCNSVVTTVKTGNLVKPQDIYFSRRGNGFSTKYEVGECITTYQVEKGGYKIPDKYSIFASPKGGYDICIIKFECHDTNVYKHVCPNIRLINDDTFGNNECSLYIYGYPYSGREEKNKRIYYYLYGMGTSKINNTNTFIIAENNHSKKQYILNKGIDTTKGQSGSCIYSYQENNRNLFLIYGVHTGGSPSAHSNYATFFDIDTINWMKNVLFSFGANVSKKFINLGDKKEDNDPQPEMKTFSGNELDNLLIKYNLYDDLGRILHDNNIDLETLQNDVPENEIDTFCSEFELTNKQKLKFTELIKTILQNKKQTQNNENERVSASSLTNTNDIGINWDYAEQLEIQALIEAEQQIKELKIDEPTHIESLKIISNIYHESISQMHINDIIPDEKEDKITVADEQIAIQKNRRYLKMKDLEPTATMEVALVGDSEVG